MTDNGSTAPAPASLLSALAELRLFDPDALGADTTVCVPDEKWERAIVAAGVRPDALVLDRSLQLPVLARGLQGAAPTIKKDLVQAATMASLGKSIWTDPREILSRPTPTNRYAILCTARSGSTWFCTLLQQVRGLGMPREHLRPPIAFLAQHAESLTFSPLEWLDLLERSESRDHAFGTKIIEEFARPILETIGPSDKMAWLDRARQYKFVHLERKDKLAQAVSRYIAEATDHWHVRNKSEQDKFLRKKQNVTYDGERISGYLQAATEGDQRIRAFLETNELAYQSLTYEDLVADPIRETLKVADVLVPDHGGFGDKRPSTRTKAVSDQLNAEFMDRFRQNPPTKF